MVYNKFKKMKKILPILIALYLVFSIFYLAPTIHAFGSSSTNYNLEGEFGIFGGAKGSTNYKLTDTGGGFAIGFGSSANYGTGSGFQYVIAEVRELVFIISTTSVNLGALTGTPTSTSHTITVTTNAHDGYQVTVIEDGNLRTGGGDTITDVSDGEVDAAGGDEEYGLATSKSGQDITQDAVCGSAPYNASAITAAAQSVASATAPIDNDTTTLCYAAVVNGATEAGSYQHVLTYIATGTF